MLLRPFSSSKITRIRKPAPKREAMGILSTIVSRFPKRTGLPVFCFCALLFFGHCSSSHKSEKEIGNQFLFQAGDFQAIPGEKLEYEVEAGLFTVGDVSVEVIKPEEEIQKGRIYIVAKASTRQGISWISRIQHLWHSWIDSTTGQSLRMTRDVTENKYHVEQDVRFLADSQMIVQRDLHRPDRPPRYFPSQPERMVDLVNMIWKIRYSPFEEKNPGDTLSYLSFFDGEWMVLKMRYAGIRPFGPKKSGQSAFLLYPVNIDSRLLRGNEPIEVWIENKPARRPLKVMISSYVGNASVFLKK
jgi:hypothetical protein